MCQMGQKKSKNFSTAKSAQMPVLRYDCRDPALAFHVSVDLGPETSILVEISVSET